MTLRIESSKETAGLRGARAPREKKMPALPGALPGSRGFSLLELLISMIVLTIVMGA
ncbi:MAG: prepilin-type N-terminal cleavage/methylation domain-containing protein, partial [Anaerolineales bacterium]